jgi:uncharacterized protein (DUF362 family)
LSESESIPRRDFIKRLGRTGLAVAGGTAGALLLHDPRSGKEYFADQRERATAKLKDYSVDPATLKAAMAIARGKDPEKLVQAVLTEMGGVEQFVQKGDVVLIKPNVAFDRPPQLGATSNPAVLQALARACFAAGARKVLVADNPINQPASCFLKSGLQQAAEEVGATLVVPKPSSFVDLAVGRIRTKAEGPEQIVGDPGEVLDVWTMFYEPFREATKVIGLAPCKDHNLCHASMTMKNWYGLLGGNRNQFHQNIHGIIADFARMMKPTLVLLDGTRVLMSNGPTGGRLSDVKEGNTLVASIDMVAADSFGYTELLERDLNELTYVDKATQAGLGTKDWKSLNPREVTV